MDTFLMVQAGRHLHDECYFPPFVGDSAVSHKTGIKIC